MNLLDWLNCKRGTVVYFRCGGTAVVASYRSDAAHGIVFENCEAYGATHFLSSGRYANSQDLHPFDIVEFRNGQASKHLEDKHPEFKKPARQSQLARDAQIYTTAAHEAVGHLRKYTEEPYIVHPSAVAEMVARAGGTDEMIAAAWLHDVVEDTKCTLHDVRAIFGDTVKLYVDQLSEINMGHVNRATRKDLQRQRLSLASPQVKTIKLADLIDNARTVIQHDPAFAKIYMAEKKELVWALKEGNHELLCQAMQIIQDYETKLLENSLKPTLNT